MLQYLIRLDDLCPTNNLSKWNRFFDLFDHYGIKPIVAVIPANEDTKLSVCGPYNPHYWSLVRGLQIKGYWIGLHGYQHRYCTKNSGIFKQNPRSEFSGLPLKQQAQKIAAAAAIFKQEGVRTTLFVAPAHSFDYNTLKAIEGYSDVSYISDGLLPYPYTRFNFKWIPVQLAEAEVKRKGTWTFNYHPETCSDRMFKNLEQFIAKYHQHFVGFSDLTYKKYQLKDYLLENYYIYRRQCLHYIKKSVYQLVKLFNRLLFRPYRASQASK
jgi:predicted deacetylase